MQILLSLTLHYNFYCVRGSPPIGNELEFSTVAHTRGRDPGIARALSFEWIGRNNQRRIFHRQAGRENRVVASLGLIEVAKTSPIIHTLDAIAIYFVCKKVMPFFCTIPNGRSEASN